MSFEKFLKSVYWFFYSSKVFDSLPDSVIFVDSEGYIIRGNERAKSCFKLFCVDKTPIHIDKILENGLNLIQASVETGKPAVTTANNAETEFPVELNAMKRWDYFCVAIRDNSQITRDINTSAKISMLNKEKNEMIVTLENEFTSPLTSITGFSKGLLDGIGGQLSEKQEKYVKIIHSNAMDLYNFISKFVEFSYSESSLCNIEFQKFDVIEVIKSVMKEFDSAAKSKKIDLTLDYGILDRRAIFSDPKMLKAVMSNVIDVSVGNTDTGYVEIKLGLPTEDDFLNFKLRENTSYLKISVEDTGTGVENSDMRTMCDPYAQASKGKKDVIKALKLGSACIFIKRLNGYINAASEPLKGTVYNIVIPTDRG